MVWRIFATLIALVIASAVANADSWLSPQVSEVFSASRDHFVRVTPGESLGDTIGFKGAKTGRYASAEFYARAADKAYRLTRTVTLKNPIAPVDFFVSNDGRLVTIDNWHNRGYGAVVVVYANDGAVVKSYALADLFSAAEIEAFSHSVSSIHWLDGPTYVNQDQKTLYLMVRSGADLIVGLESGLYAYCETREGTYKCRDSNVDRAWRPHGDVAPTK
jgi:hypothetical protein